MSLKSLNIRPKVSATLSFLLLFQVGFAQQNFSKVNDWLIKNVPDLGGRAVLMIYKDGKIVYSETVNNLSKQQETRGKIKAKVQGKDVDDVLQDYTTTTRERIASSSKWLTAALLMTYVDENKVRLTDSVGKFLPVMTKYGKGGILEPKQLFAEKYTVSGFRAEYASMNSPYDLMGVVFRNIFTGERMKVRNATYEMVKNYKGVDQKVMLQYLTLRHGGRVADYLKTYPEYKGDFAAFRSQLHGFTRSLHQNYLDCFVFKKRIFSEFPQQYKKHMSGLHKKYLEELREIKGSVTFQYVVEFVNTQNPMYLMYSLNYVAREHKKTVERMDEVSIACAENIET